MHVNNGIYLVLVALFVSATFFDVMRPSKNQAFIMTLKR